MNLRMRIGTRLAGSCLAPRRTPPQRKPQENAEVVEEWNVVASSTGHRAPRVEDDENLGEQLVADGIEEAAHDQMLEARKEELEAGRLIPLNATDPLVAEVLAGQDEVRPRPARRGVRSQELIANIPARSAISALGFAAIWNRRITSCNRCRT